MRPRSSASRQIAVSEGQLLAIRESCLSRRRTAARRGDQPVSGWPIGRGTRPCWRSTRGVRPACTQPQERASSGALMPLAAGGRSPMASQRSARSRRWRSIHDGREPSTWACGQRAPSRASSRRQTGAMAGAEPARDTLSRRSRSTPDTRQRSTQAWDTTPNLGSSGAPTAGEAGPSWAEPLRTLGGTTSRHLIREGLPSAPSSGSGVGARRRTMAPGGGLRISLGHRWDTPGLAAEQASQPRAHVQANPAMGREGFEPSTLGLRVPCSTN